jgi:hypothetical protein
MEIQNDTLGYMTNPKKVKYLFILVK